MLPERRFAHVSLPRVSRVSLAHESENATLWGKGRPRDAGVRTIAAAHASAGTQPKAAITRHQPSSVPPEESHSSVFFFFFFCRETRRSHSSRRVPSEKETLLSRRNCPVECLSRGERERRAPGCALTPRAKTSMMPVEMETLKRPPSGPRLLASFAISTRTSVRFKVTDSDDRAFQRTRARVLRLSTTLSILSYAQRPVLPTLKQPTRSLEEARRERACRAASPP